LFGNVYTTKSSGDVVMNACIDSDRIRKNIGTRRESPVESGQFVTQRFLWKKSQLNRGIRATGISDPGFGLGLGPGLALAPAIALCRGPGLRWRRGVAGPGLARRKKEPASADGA
jgi:hypothetical protein